MTPQYRYYTDKSSELSFEAAVDKMLQRVNCGVVVRITLFTTCSSNTEYIEQHSSFKRALKEQFGDMIPAWSLIAQQPLDSVYCCEVAELNDSRFKIEHKDYGVEVFNSSYREVVVGGVSGDPINDTIEKQCNDIFSKMSDILKSSATTADRIVRQWNYIENITSLEGTKQHYQLFNDARSKLYNSVVWKSGYPAATGIGSSFGGIVIDFNVIATTQTPMYRLDNSLQVAAHRYSQSVLIGEASYGFDKNSTPKFERAKLVEGSDNILLYISGTAAIRGEESLRGQDATIQTVITMENINHLISVETQREYGVDIAQEVCLQTLRVYIKNTKDYNDISKYMGAKYPNCHKLFLHCDVCREELLVEIEGLATTKTTN